MRSSEICVQVVLRLISNSKAEFPTVTFAPLTGVLYQGPERVESRSVVPDLTRYLDRSVALSCHGPHRSEDGPR